MQNDKKFILFDFDGVITDSFKTALNVIQAICPHISAEHYKKGFEGNINEWQKLRSEHTEDCRLDADFFEEYVPRMKTEMQMFPVMKEVIQECAEKYTLVVISSTTSDAIKYFLDKYSVADCFAEILGNDVSFSKVEKIKMVFNKYTIQPQDCVFVTDTLGDMKEARHMDVDAIGVLWGFHDQETLSKGKPVSFVKRPQEILQAVDDYFKNK